MSGPDTGDATLSGAVAGDDPEEQEPGLARERTTLAWTRTAISFAGLGAVVLKTNWISGLVILAVAPVIWQLGRVTRGQPDPVQDQNPDQAKDQDQDQDQDQNRAQAKDQDPDQDQDQNRAPATARGPGARGSAAAPAAAGGGASGSGASGSTRSK